MKTCGGCDGSMADRQQGTTAGTASGVSTGKVDTINDGKVLNPGSNPERKA